MPKFLDAWKKQATRIIEVDNGLQIEFKILDPLAMLGATNGDAPNPLMQIISKMIADGGLGESAMRDPETAGKMALLLREISLKAIIDPPLTENGNDPDQSISVDVIPLKAKMDILQELLGGAETPDASSFLQGQASPVVAAQPSQTLQPAAQ